MLHRLPAKAVVVLLSIPGLLWGCGPFAPTANPIPSISTVSGDSPSDTLVIMLPGRGDRGETFIANGFEQEGARLGFDTIAVDAHLAYYRKRILLPRLHEDIVLPAKAAGYKNIWLLGVSMGGFGSLLYAAEHPGEIDGVILIAPYLGNPELAKDVAAEGGVANWTGEGADYEDYEIDVWEWLQAATGDKSRTPVMLGYGNTDSSAPVHAVLGEALAPSSVYVMDGGHKWTVWRPLWTQIASDLKF